MALGSWWLRRPAVQLDQASYEVTLALYRVCNQRNTDGLDQVEELLANSQHTDTEPLRTVSSESHDAIQRVIDLAKTGEWDRATRECRMLMDDQVDP